MEYYFFLASGCFNVFRIVVPVSCFLNLCFLQMFCISLKIHMINLIFLWLKISFVLLCNNLFSLICPWKVWQEESAVCDSGDADWLQLHTGLLYQLGDVFSVIPAGRHGADLQLRGSVCSWYESPAGHSMCSLILCFSCSFSVLA